MSYIAFCGDVINPILYSIDDEEWYLPDGSVYTEYKMTDKTPIPSRDYNKKAKPDSRYYTITKVSKNNKVALVCDDEEVYLLVDDKAIPGKIYTINFYLTCRIPTNVDNNRMLFEDIDSTIDIDIPEYPFINKFRNIFVSGDISYNVDTVTSDDSNNNSCVCSTDNSANTSTSSDDANADILTSGDTSNITSNAKSDNVSNTVNADILTSGDTSNNTNFKHTPSNEYNDRLPCYSINREGVACYIYFNCDDSIKDYFTRIRTSCTKLNDESLSKTYGPYDIAYIDGFYKNFVIMNGTDIKVYKLKFNKFLTFGGHYEISDESELVEYYKSRLMSIINTRSRTTKSTKKDNNVRDNNNTVNIITDIVTHSRDYPDRSSYDDYSTSSCDYINNDDSSDNYHDRYSNTAYSFDDDYDDSHDNRNNDEGNNNISNEKLRDEILTGEGDLHDISEQYGIPYTKLLLKIWFEMSDIIRTGETKSSATDTRRYQYTYNQLGHHVQNELNNLLANDRWYIINKDNSNNNNTEGYELHINNKYTVISDSYDPQITIAGAVTKGMGFSHVPDLSGHVIVL